jgi:hypothetical protein
LYQRAQIHTHAHERGPLQGKLSPSPCETHVSFIVSKPHHWPLISRCINQVHRHSLRWHKMLPKSDWESLTTQSVQKKASGQR